MKKIFLSLLIGVCTLFADGQFKITETKSVYSSSKSEQHITKLQKELDEFKDTRLDNVMKNLNDSYVALENLYPKLPFDIFERKKEIFQNVNQAKDAFIKYNQIKNLQITYQAIHKIYLTKFKELQSLRKRYIKEVSVDLHTIKSKTICDGGKEFKVFYDNQSILSIMPIKESIKPRLREYETNNSSRKAYVVEQAYSVHKSCPK